MKTEHEFYHDPKWLTIAKADLDEGYDWYDASFEVKRNCPEYLDELQAYHDRTRENDND